jgi:hypothetical protein
MEELLLSAVVGTWWGNDVRQTEMHTAEPLVPEYSSFEVGIAIENLERYKSPYIYQIMTELIHVGGNTLRSEIHIFVISVWNKEELPQLWKESIIVPIYKSGDKSDCCNYRGISLLPSTYKILTSILSQV